MNVPAVDDKILVPDNTNIFGKCIGGWATVNRVVTGLGNVHYINVTEHTGYVTYVWEGNLAELQDELNRRYKRTDIAYIKSV
jgi:hypothetical protein